jgi:chromosome segregation ATPase
MLREEKDGALRQIQQLKNRVEELELELGPLRVKNAELEGKCESLMNENTGLKQDLSRWRARAAVLLEKSTKINPEEWKKLQTEKDTLTRQLTASTENVKKQQQEIGRHLQQVKLLQQQVAALQTNTQTLTQEKKTLTEEAKKNNDERARIKIENDGLRAENNSVRNALAAKEKEAAELQNNLTKALADVEEQKGVVRQVSHQHQTYAIHQLPLSIPIILNLSLLTGERNSEKVQKVL